MYKPDEGQAEILAALRKRGAICFLIEGANGIRGVPDILVAARKQTWLLETKKPLGPKGGKRGGSLSKEQEEFARLWVLHGGPCAVVRSPEDALLIVFGGKP